MPLLNNSTGLGRGESKPTGTLDELLGTRVVFADNDYSTKMQTKRTGGETVMELVKNDSGAAMLPNKVVKYGAAAGERRNTVDAYAGANDTGHGVVDEFLPAAGVPNGEYFWMAVDGPCKIINSSAAALVIGDHILTSATGEVGKRAAEADNDDYIGTAEAAIATSATGIIYFRPRVV